MEDTLRRLQDEFHVSPANAGSSGPRALTGRDGWICTHQDSGFQQVRLESRGIEPRVYGDAAIWCRYRMRDASIREGPSMANSWEDCTAQTSLTADCQTWKAT